MDRTRSLSRILTAALATDLIISAAALADVRLNDLFCDGMVLQREMSVPVFGRTDRGEKITVEIAGQRKTVTSDLNGRFRVNLDPLKAGGPYELKVTGRNSIVIRDILVGEVWVCSGQSNMEMQVRECLNAEDETAAADYPQIRQFKVKRGKAAVPQDTMFTSDEDREERTGAWVACSPGTVGDFSAAAYFFARELHKRLGVPVGLINSSWGGTVCEAWTSERTMEGVPELKSILADWPKYNDDGPWLKQQYANFMQEKEEAKLAGKPAPLYYNQPAVLYNAMICPLEPYGIRGAIWYQGESNVMRACQYRDLFPAMIRNWRHDWGRDFPFIFVQLANFEDEIMSWAELREAQLMTLRREPNTGMTVTTDIGTADDIHPKNKQEVGRRLSLAARALVYGETGLEWSGPLYRSMSVDGGRVRIAFDHAEDGLTSPEGRSLGGFTVAGADRQFVPAQAVVDGQTVVVWSDDIKDPAAVRFGWKNNPEDANLYNMVEGKLWLPASPFRTDDWPGLTANRKW